MISFLKHSTNLMLVRIFFFLVEWKLVRKKYTSYKVAVKYFQLNCFLSLPFCVFSLIAFHLCMDLSFLSFFFFSTLHGYLHDHRLYGKQILNRAAMIQVIIDMLGLRPVKDKIIFPFSCPQWYKYSLLELKSFYRFLLNSTPLLSHGHWFVMLGCLVDTCFKKP